MWDSYKEYKEPKLPTKTLCIPTSIVVRTAWRAAEKPRYTSATDRLPYVNPPWI
jgi:hypothetical protein